MAEMEAEFTHRQVTSRPLKPFVSERFRHSFLNCKRLYTTNCRRFYTTFVIVKGFRVVEYFAPQRLKIGKRDRTEGTHGRNGG